MDSKRGGAGSGEYDEGTTMMVGRTRQGDGSSDAPGDAAAAADVSNTGSQGLPEAAAVGSEEVAAHQDSGMARQDLQSGRETTQGDVAEDATADDGEASSQPVIHSDPQLGEFALPTDS